MSNNKNKDGLVNVTLTMTEEEREMIKNRAKDKEMSISKYMIKMTLGNDCKWGSKILTSEGIVKITNMMNLAMDITEKNGDKELVNLMGKMVNEIWSLLN
jgi:hypothetical protein